MKHYTFSGTATIKRKFSIEIPGTNYETAQEKALDLLADVDDSENYTIGDDEVEIEIDSFEESTTSKFSEDRREYDYYSPVA